MAAQPWERHPEETDRQYEAFSAYRDMRPGRSIAKAAASLGLGSSTHLEEWSRHNNWVERARAYDAYLDKVRLQGAEDAHRKELEDHRGRVRNFGAAAVETAALMLALANHNLRTEKDKLDKSGDKNAHKVTFDRYVPSWVRAASVVASAGVNAEAHAIGVDKLVEAVTDNDTEEEIG